MHRKQMVKLGSVLSDWKLVNSGERKWCIEDDMVLNHSKCKELIISSLKVFRISVCCQLELNSIFWVPLAKVLGLFFSSGFRWNLHVEHIVAKASKRLYFLSVLKRGVSKGSLIEAYFTCMRPVLEYSCQGWNISALDYFKEEIERIKECALQIIYPAQSVILRGFGVQRNSII